MNEFSVFNTKVPYPDVLPGPESLQQLPLLRQFFQVCSSTNVRISSTEGTNNFSQLIGMLEAALEPMGFGQFLAHYMLFGLGSRKCKLRPQLNKTLKSILDAKFSPEAAGQVQASVKTHANMIKAELKSAGSTRKGLEDRMQKRLQACVNSTETSYFDFPQLSPMTRNTQLLPKGAPRAKIEEWEQFTAKISDDWAYAQALRNEMVTKE